VIDETSDLGKLVAAAKKRNFIAMLSPPMAFDSEAMMAFIFVDEWPSGLAHLVVAALFKRFQPQDTMTRVQLRTKSGKVSMKIKDNPATIFEQLNMIKNQYTTPGQRIDEADLMAVVINTAPKDYQSLLAN
jgi:hypothetical protein